MSVINQNLLLTPEGYQISRSVRLRSSASAYFNRTPSGAGSRTTWTYSTWRKRGQLGNYMWMLSALVSAGTVDGIRFQSDNTLDWIYNGSRILATTQVFRDPSAWYHLMFVWDTTQATSSNRVKIYVNGVQVAAFSTSAYPAQNSQSAINNAVLHRIGGTADTLNSEMFDGYETEDVFVDGQALTPISFGETDAVTGVWKPKKYAGTYGTNGFYLNFSDNSSNTSTTIGKDYSGNGNNWTPNNISVTTGSTYDSMLDVPTMYADGGNGRGNYAVWNAAAIGTDATLSAGNLNISYSSNTPFLATAATIGMQSGKWYWEIVITASSASPAQCIMGITTKSSPNEIGSYPGANANGWGYYTDGGLKVNNGTFTAYGSSYTTNDVIGIAFDADVGTLVFYKNNTSQGTAFSSLTSGPYFPAIGDGSGGATHTAAANFGQRPFAYTPPTGFKALNTQNLPDSTIKKGNQYFDATTYTGNGTSQSIVNSGGFQPDLVWLKGRNAVSDNSLYDAIRGVTKELVSNTTTAEATVAQGLTSFNANGFSLGTAAWLNTNSNTYVGWQWKKSVSAGFDIVTYTGNGALRTLSHSLGVAPKMVIVKSRSAGSTNWCVQHASIGATHVGYMNLTNAFTTNASMWNNTAPTSSVFTVNTNTDVNGNGTTYVAYLFAEVAGYSKLGSYTGNGSTDGPFVYLGFRPKFVLVKRSDSTSDWVLWDTSRDTYNAAQAPLFPNLSVAEGNSYFMDALSNGFKLRMSTITNVNGGNYIYAAFAENPFKNSLAR